MRILISLAALILFFLAAPVQAADSLPPSVKKVETYLQNLHTAQARFVQTAYNGNRLSGTFYLNRPGKLRFEYDDPIEDFIVADGFFIYFYDAELGEQSNAPIGQTLADFLLRADLRLSGDITVARVENNGQLLLVTLVQTEDPEAGAITLGFEENPLRLKKWRVSDSQNRMTEIELFQLQREIDLADSLFIYSNPNRFEESYNE